MNTEQTETRARHARRRDLEQFETLRREWRLQLEHGGYSVPPGAAACALERARHRLQLEELIEQGRASVDWHPDDGVDLSWADEEQLEEIRRGRWTVESCMVEIGGEWNTIGGVVGPPEDLYRRTLEAELAGEILERQAREESIRLYWARRDLATIG